MNKILYKQCDVSIASDGGVYNTDTGELRMDLAMAILPTGSKIYTPAQQEAYKHRKNAEAKNKIRRATTNKLGNFYFARVQNYGDLSPATAVRLIYLMSYLTYDGRLATSSRGKTIKRKDLAKLLNISDSVAYSFYNEVKDKYISEDVNGGLIAVNSEIFIRGKIKTRQLQSYYQRVYIKGVRTLYENTPVSKHKNLGHFFKVLEYINVEFNVLCHNTFESDLNAIDLMTLGELCDLIGYDRTQIQRLIKVFNSLTINVDGTQEYFVSFVVNKGNGQAKIFINPRILYAGSQYDRVAVLGAFCKADKKKPRHFSEKPKSV